MRIAKQDIINNNNNNTNNNNNNHHDDEETITATDKAANNTKNRSKIRASGCSTKSIPHSGRPSACDGTCVM